MYKALLSDYEARQQTLMQENSELKKLLQHMKKDMVSILSPKKTCAKAPPSEDHCCKDQPTDDSCSKVPPTDDSLEQVSTHTLLTLREELAPLKAHPSLQCNSEHQHVYIQCK